MSAYYETIRIGRQESLQLVQRRFRESHPAAGTSGLARSAGAKIGSDKVRRSLDVPSPNRKGPIDFGRAQGILKNLE